jgi:hypothetical protein
MSAPHDKLVVAYFGGSGGAPLARRVVASWWAWTKTVSQELGVPLTHIDAKFTDKVRGLRDQKPYDISNYEDRFRQQLECHNVQTLDLNALGDPSGYIAFDWTITSSAGVDQQFGSIALLGLDMCVVAGWDRSDLVTFLHRTTDMALKVMQVDYGFAVVMPKQSAPSSYAMGIASRGSDERLVFDATAWRRFARRDCRKYLRNVYGWSLLSRDHLELDLKGIELKTWVQQTPKRGRLEPAGSTNVCWSFDDEAEGSDFLRWDFGPVIDARRDLEERGVFPWQQLPGATS